MLIYNPAFDLYHSGFRMLRLLQRLPRQPFPVERVRILDFYLLFPGALKEVTFPKEAMRLRRKLVGGGNRYEDVRDPRRIFARLEPFQRAALGHLAAHYLIEPEIYSEGKVQRTEKALPPLLLASVDLANASDTEALALLTGPFLNIDLYGKSGLKARTQLFEHRYDPI